MRRGTRRHDVVVLLHGHERKRSDYTVALVASVLAMAIAIGIVTPTDVLSALQPE